MASSSKRPLSVQTSVSLSANSGVSFDANRSRKILQLDTFGFLASSSCEIIAGLLHRSKRKDWPGRELDLASAASIDTMYVSES